MWSFSQLRKHVSVPPDLISVPALRSDLPPHLPPPDAHSLALMDLPFLPHHDFEQGGDVRAVLLEVVLTLVTEGGARQGSLTRVYRLG